LIPGLNNIPSIGSVPTLRKAFNQSQSFTPKELTNDLFSKTD